MGKWGTVKILVLDIDKYFFPVGHRVGDVKEFLDISVWSLAEGTRLELPNLALTV